MIAVALAERGLVPEALVRFGIRRRLRNVRDRLYGDGLRDGNGAARFAQQLARGPAALEQDRVNRQHYELPPEFFAAFLGKWRKYSCCYWPKGVTDLDEAEEAMLELTAARAGIEPGQSVLDLGCGWGSFSLWAAERFPDITVHALSNSTAQIEHIRRQGFLRGLPNLAAETADVTCYETSKRFDRVVSVEMVEHIRNWRDLMKRVSSWLNPGGKCFLHFFCHKEWPYLFSDEDPADWMGYHFFAGGMMPSFDLPVYFNEALEAEASWAVNGSHYVLTLEAWLRRLEHNRHEARQILEKTYGSSWRVWENRWRIFLMACSELFATSGGDEWFVAHYLLKKGRFD
ncbi:MAG: SAM-dependent methyltransferase [Thermovirgaceae bacterium]